MKHLARLAGLLAAAAAAGAILGVLFAPDKGSTTRKKIKELVRDLSENIKSNTQKTGE